MKKKWKEKKQKPTANSTAWQSQEGKRHGTQNVWLAKIEEIHRSQNKRNIKKEMLNYSTRAMMFPFIMDFDADFLPVTLERFETTESSLDVCFDLLISKSYLNKYLYSRFLQFQCLFLLFYCTKSMSILDYYFNVKWIFHFQRFLASTKQNIFSCFWANPK